MIQFVQKNQFFRFILVGIACAGIEFIIFNILVYNYRVDYLQANLFSLLVAVILNYFLSRKIVFLKGIYSGKIEFMAFILVSVLGISLNQYLLWAFAENTDLDIRIGKIFVIGFVAFFNFFLKKYIVFKK